MYDFGGEKFAEGGARGVGVFRRDEGRKLKFNSERRFFVARFDATVGAARVDF